VIIIKEGVVCAPFIGLMCDACSTHGRNRECFHKYLGRIERKNLEDKTHVRMRRLQEPLTSTAALMRAQDSPGSALDPVMGYAEHATGSSGST
jgi:hypothetical protein